MEGCQQAQGAGAQALWGEDEKLGLFNLEKRQLWGTW